MQSEDMECKSVIIFSVKSKRPCGAALKIRRKMTKRLSIKYVSRFEFI